jgi:hypothetical protein
MAGQSTLGATRTTGGQVEEGVLGRGLAYFKVGSGAPLVFAPGLSPDHHRPRGMNLHVQLQQLWLLAANRTVWWINRRQGLAPRASMVDIADDYADALRTTFSAPSTSSVSRPVAAWPSSWSWTIPSSCAAW